MFKFQRKLLFILIVILYYNHFELALINSIGSYLFSLFGITLLGDITTALITFKLKHGINDDEEESNSRN